MLPGSSLRSVRPFLSRRPLALALAALGVLLAGSAILWHELSAPTTVFLVSEGGARWIRVPGPVTLNRREPGLVTARFRRRFAAGPGQEAALTLRALKGAAVFLDGKLLQAPRLDLSRWREPIRLDLSPHLSPGTHDLQIHVVNRNGPAALLCRSAELDLATGQPGWEASATGESWEPAADADVLAPPPLHLPHATSLAALRQALPLLLPLFAGAAGASFWLQRRTRPGAAKAARLLEPSRVRWILLGLWGALAANNLLRGPVAIGYDFFGHRDYILYVAEHWRVPLAGEGWQMFQPPLYYLVSAAIHWLLSPFLEEDAVLRLLRVVPLGCGLLQVQLAYLATRAAFPRRPDLQVAGTVAGGLLPMNTCISQFLGNEPLAAALLSGAMVLTLRLLRSPPAAGRRGPWILLGLLLGLSLLAKVSALLAVPVVLGVLAARLGRQSRPAPAIVGDLSWVLGAAVAVCGWYYLRNWIELGRPFYGGWDPERGIAWWQDPGYRTPRQLLTFGAALLGPVYAAVHGFWDAFYSTLWADGYNSGLLPSPVSPTPWNHTFHLAGVPLALLPSAALLAGAVRAACGLPGEARWHLAFAALALSVFLGALLVLYIRVPILTAAKATYTLGLLPCYAVLAADGLDRLWRPRLLRPLIHGLLACWAACAYLTFFVVS